MGLETLHQILQTSGMLLVDYQGLPARSFRTSFVISWPLASPTTRVPAGKALFKIDRFNA